MGDKQNKKDSNASASLSGWNFQVAAAIYIFLTMIKEVTEIGLEKTEDIELILKNGKVVFAQAKSSLSPDEIELNSHYPEINKAFSTLEGREECLIEKLIIIFNYYKPFGNDAIFDVKAYDKKRFSDLNSNVKGKLTNKITEKQYEVDLDSLEFWMLKFDGIEQHSSTLSYFKEALNLKRTVDYKRIIESWRILLYDNGTQAKRYIEKQALAGSVFKEFLDNNITEEIFDNLNMDVYSGDLDDFFLPEYQNHIDMLTRRFSLVTEINSLYHEFMNKNRSIKRSEALILFVNTEYYNVSDEVKHIFNDIKDQSRKEMLLKIFIYKIGFKYNIIAEISEVMGL
jgi:hypothetical protein